MIPNIDFDDLITTKDWADALQSILTAASAATAAANSTDRSALRGLLLTFIKNSPPKVELLDVIAREAIEDLALADISQSLQRIASRNAELEQATKMIAGVTAEAQKDARTLQLESTLSALAKAQTAIDALRAIETSGPLNAKLSSVADAIAAVNALVPKK